MSAFAFQYASASPDDEVRGAAEASLLENGDFELPNVTNVNPPVAKLPQGWESSTTQMFPVVSPPSWGANLGIKPYDKQFIDLYGDMSRKIQVAPGKKIRWRIAHTSVAYTTNFNVTLSEKVNQPNRAPNEKTFVVPVTKGDWKLTSGEYTVPEWPGVAATSLEVKVAAGTGPGGVYLDDFRIEYAPTLKGTVDVGNSPLYIGKELKVSTEVKHEAGGPLEDAMYTVPLPEGVDVDLDKVVVSNKDGTWKKIGGAARFEDGTMRVQLGPDGTVAAGDTFVVTYGLMMKDGKQAPQSLEFAHDPVIKHNWAKDAEIPLPEAKTMIKVASTDLVLDSATFSKKSYVQGEQAALSVKVVNAGAQPAQDVVVKVKEPANVGRLEWNEEELSCTRDAMDILTCAVGEVPAGGSRTLGFTGEVAANVGKLTGVANVSTPSTLDPVTTNNELEFSSDASNGADLKVQAGIQSEQGEPLKEAKPGEKAYIAVTVGNDGPARPGKEFTVRVHGPSGAEPVNLAPTDDYDKDKGEWTIAGLDADKSTTLKLAVTVPADKEALSATAELISFGGVDDTTRGNNRSETEVPIAMNAEMDVSVSADREGADKTYAPGQQVTYTIVAKNNGPSPARNVKISHLMPAGMGVLQQTGPHGTDYDPAEGTWVVPLIGVGPDSAATITVKGIVPADQEKTLHRVCITGADIPDPRGGFKPCGEAGAVKEHVASQELTVTQQADARVKVSANRPQAVPGQSVTWTVEASNDGPSTAKGLEIGVALPKEVTDVAVDKDGGSFDQDSGVWKPADIMSKGTAVLKLTGKAPADQDVVTTAKVTASGTPLKDQDKVIGAEVKHTLSVRRQADLNVSVTPGAETVKTGAEGSVTVKVSNAGPSTAEETSVELALPPGLKGVDHDGGDGFDPATGTWKAGGLKSGDERSLTLTFTADKPKDYRFDVLAVSSKADDPNECVDICGSASVRATATGGGTDEPGEGSGPTGDAPAGGSQTPSGDGAGKGGDGAAEEQSVLDQALAATGSHALWWGAGALGAVGIGAALLIAARRRNSGG
ncbi:hypothetical protein [Streptomyces sp. NPDC086023]|uniref:hypothetical protein n=1 Tax=Streptomyces sp. NPDC086023 TaxID=3365746 RepID=UPI0037CF7F18